MPLSKMEPEEFVRRLRAQAGEPDRRYAFFVGAGCSVSSGVPAAGALVQERWLPRLKSWRAPHDLRPLDEWAKAEFPDYDPGAPALAYGPVMEAVFMSADDRQREVEALCESRFPNFGYAVLAELVAYPNGAFNVVLTTNFDDLMPDAQYLFTDARPLVIHHESLAGYIRVTRTRPMLVKVHGDHRLSPQNTGTETEHLKEAIDRPVRLLLHDRGLVFIGYGGNDRGIVEMLEKLEPDALPHNVYWVSGSEPQGVIRPWLDARGAVWIQKHDFDELMVLFKEIFELPNPDRGRFESVFDRYAESYAAISSRIGGLPDEQPGVKALKRAANKIRRSFSGWWAVELEAYELSDSDPDAADAVYRRGIAELGEVAPLLGNYALFLTSVRKDEDAAEAMFKRALEADPNHANNLGNYALFLQNVRKNYGGAEALFMRVLETDPSQANQLGNYALFLQNVRKNYDGAEALFTRVLETDPNHAINLGNYALFRHTIRKDYDGAEAMFRRALEADPNHANNLDNYAIFLTGVRKDHDGAEALYRRALEADPNDATALGNYALFLTDVRKDHDGAEAMYRRALEAEPNLADNLGNFARLLLANGRREEGLAALAKAEAAVSESTAGVEDPLRLEVLYYRFAHGTAAQRQSALHRLKELLVSGARSEGWDFSRNAERAIADGHDDGEWLAVLGGVISGEKPIEALEGWPRWQAS